MVDQADLSREELIRRRAYEIWELEGWPEGRHLANWKQAKAEIDGQLQVNQGDRERQDALLDEALEETFPSSDPVSPKQIT